MSHCWGRVPPRWVALGGQRVPFSGCGGARHRGVLWAACAGLRLCAPIICWLRWCCTLTVFGQFGECVTSSVMLATWKMGLKVCAVGCRAG